MTGEMSREMYGRTFPARNVLKCTAEMSAGTFRAGNVRGMGRRDISGGGGATALRGSAFPASRARRPLRDRPPVGPDRPPPANATRPVAPRTPRPRSAGSRAGSRWGICRVFQWPPATCPHAAPGSRARAGWLRDWRAGVAVQTDFEARQRFEDGVHPGEECLVGARGFRRAPPAGAGAAPGPARASAAAPSHPPQQGRRVLLLEGDNRCRVGALGEVRNRLHPEPLRLAEPGGTPSAVTATSCASVFAGARRAGPIGGRTQGGGEAGGSPGFTGVRRPARAGPTRPGGRPPSRDRRSSAPGAPPFVADHHEDRRSRLQALRAQGVEAGERDVRRPVRGPASPGRGAPPRAVWRSSVRK